MTGGTFTFEHPLRLGKRSRRTADGKVTPVPAEFHQYPIGWVIPVHDEQIFARAGVKLAHSILAEWVGVCGVRLQPLVDVLWRLLLAQAVLRVDEIPVLMLPPGQKNTKWAYLWAYASSDSAPLNAVIYDFTEGRAAERARRKFFDLQQANQSQLAEQALQLMGQLYDVER